MSKDSSSSSSSDSPIEKPKQSTVSHISYSERYIAKDAEYRHVILPPSIAKICPKGRLLSEVEWRGLGVQQSKGWTHYAIHRPEPHILLFKRALESDEIVKPVPDPPLVVVPTLSVVRDVPTLSVVPVPPLVVVVPTVDKTSKTDVTDKQDIPVDQEQKC